MKKSLIRFCNANGFRRIDYDFSFSNSLNTVLKNDRKRVSEILNILLILYGFVSETENSALSLVGGQVSSLSNNYYGDIDLWIFSDTAGTIIKRFVHQSPLFKKRLSALNFSLRISKIIIESKTNYRIQIKDLTNNQRIIDLLETQIKSNYLFNFLHEQTHKFTYGYSIVPQSLSFDLHHTPSYLYLPHNRPV